MFFGGFQIFQLFPLLSLSIKVFIIKGTNLFTEELRLTVTRETRGVLM